jgi:hypothetical protein
MALNFKTKIANKGNRWMMLNELYMTWIICCEIYFNENSWMKMKLVNQNHNIHEVDNMDNEKNHMDKIQ